MTPPSSRSPRPASASRRSTSRAPSSWRSKIAQGSKPGEGGQLPSKKVTPLIARLRRAQTGISLISPPPHHDIYSIEDLAQLIADLRAINPGARIGVKLVAALGIGPIAAGVAKAGADYIQISGHVGGTGASPLSSIKHVGIPWELGLAEVHQVLMRNDLRDRVALRTDGGLQTGRDVVVAALLGAEEYGFGTAGLIALGCDMARQCHLDTCPDGHRHPARGPARQVHGHARGRGALLHGHRRGCPLGAVPAGSQQRRRDRGRRRACCGRPRTGCAPSTSTGSSARRPGHPAATDVPTRAGRAPRCEREPASPAEARLADKYMHLPDVEEDPQVPGVERPVGGHDPDPLGIAATITTAERSFGAHTSGLIERARVRRPVRWRLAGAAGQSFGAFSNQDVSLELVGQANDYVGKGLSGGKVVVRPDDALLERAADLAIAGNACLYGATGGRLHLVGRAGIRFAVRNSGASAVVEGVGAHGCEYMTGGVVVILGGIGPNFGAGMTGGRAYLWDPDRHGHRRGRCQLRVLDAAAGGGRRARRRRRTRRRAADPAGGPPRGRLAAGPCRCWPARHSWVTACGSSSRSARQLPVAIPVAEPPAAVEGSPSSRSADRGDAAGVPRLRRRSALPYAPRT